MMMSEEETKWIWSNYKTCPLYVAIEKLVMGVSCVDGAPAEHPSLLFYLVINAIDDIKCASTKQRRLDKCKEMKELLVFYLKNKRYDNPNSLAAEILICVKSALLVCSELEYVQEIAIIYDHFHKLLGNGEFSNKLRISSITCFKGDKLEAWLGDYIESKVFISEDIVRNVTEIRNKYSKQYLDGSDNEVKPYIDEIRHKFFKDKIWVEYKDSNNKRKSYVELPVDKLLHTIYDFTPDWNPENRTSARKWRILYELLNDSSYLVEHNRPLYTKFLNSVVKYRFDNVKDEYADNIRAIVLDSDVEKWRKGDKGLYHQLNKVLGIENLIPAKSF